MEITYDQHRLLKQMFKTTKSPEHKGIKEAKEKGFVIGAKVIIKWGVDDTGNATIVNYRDRVGGVYCAERYPVNVKRDDGLVFEYGLDQLELV